MEISFHHAKEAGMKIMMVETGDDPGHKPSRSAYESMGFTRWPVARYFRVRLILGSFRIYVC